MRSRSFVWGTAAASVASLVLAAPLRAEGPYKDAATAEWFAGLASAYAPHCCDQADCHIALSDYRDGSWWALSNRTGTWVRIMPNQVTSDVSIFKDAVLCEGDPLLASDGAGHVTGQEPRVYCFAPPPLGF